MNTSNPPRFLPNVVIDSTGARWELEHGYCGPVYWHEESDGAPDGWRASVDYWPKMTLQDLQRDIEDEVVFHNLDLD